MFIEASCFEVHLSKSRLKCIYVDGRLLVSSFVRHSHPFLFAVTKQFDGILVAQNTIGFLLASLQNILQFSRRLFSLHFLFFPLFVAAHFSLSLESLLNGDD